MLCEIQKWQTKEIIHNWQSNVWQKNEKLKICSNTALKAMR